MLTMSHDVFFSLFNNIYADWYALWACGGDNQNNEDQATADVSGGRAQAARRDAAGPRHRKGAGMAVDHRAAEEERLRAKWSDPKVVAAAGGQQVRLRPTRRCGARGAKEL